MHCIQVEYDSVYTSAYKLLQHLLRIYLYNKDTKGTIVYTLSCILRGRHFRWPKVHISMQWISNGEEQLCPIRESGYILVSLYINENVHSAKQ